MVYLDNAATTYPKPVEVYEVMDKVNRTMAVNSGRGDYKMARRAGDLISETKALLRNLVHVDASTAVIFSSSITISLNQIINGIAWEKIRTVYVSPYEHNAVARPLNYISKRYDITVKQLPINKDTLEIDIDKMRYEFSKDKPEILFCTHISNVTGYILPIDEIFNESKKYGCINILDSAQSLGLVPVDTKIIDVDIIAFAGHKTLYGPLGIGGFINVTGIPLNEFIVGGTGSDSLNLDMPQGNEVKFEVASKNIVAIAGLNEALKMVNIEMNFQNEKKKTEYLIERLSSIANIKLFLPANKDKHVSIVSFVHDRMKSDDIGMILDEDFDIAVRTGYHCAPYIHKYLKDEGYLGTVRVGVSRFTEKKDIDALIDALKDLG